MKTKLFALLFVLCFAVGWLPLSAHAEEIQEYSHEAVPEYPVEIRFVPIPDVLSIWLTCQVEDGDCFYDWYEDLPEPERDGYTFLNWSASPVDNRPFDPYLPITGYYPRPLYLYGFWEESAPSYDVTFVVDGDTYYETVAEDGILSDWPDAPEKDGAFFKQWQTEDGALPGETIDSDITFYACWYDSVITYDPNGNLENGAFPSEQYPADNGEPTPEYSRELETDTHSFLGWEPEFSQIVTGSVTYTAIWEENPQNPSP